MENRVAKLVKYSFGPTSCLAASLAEFELFIHELCRFALPHAKIQSCQHVKQSQPFDEVVARSIVIYTVSDGRIWQYSNSKRVSLNSQNMALRVSRGEVKAKQVSN